MDDAVLRAIAKWPNVPHAYGWLSLDCRGNWLLKGERITNPAVTAFIGRNYTHDDQGRWFFQNGPQRVFVALASTPYIYSTETTTGRLSFVTHTGLTARRIESVLADECGRLLVVTEYGVGLLDDRELVRMSPKLLEEDGTPVDETHFSDWLTGGGAYAPRVDLDGTTRPLERVDSSRLAFRFGFVRNPRPAPGEPEC